MNELNGPATYRAIAQALPWKIQSALLAIRDEGRVNLPNEIYYALYELQLIEEEKPGDEELRLSRLGKHLVDYCTC